MSKPFEDLHIDLNKLKIHPEPSLFKKALLSSGKPERIGLANLWLSEGIPHAFMSCPSVYQQLRSELSNKLKIGVKDISVVGSSRLGYSLADCRFGKAFNENSDLDLFAVNECLYNHAKTETLKFIDDIKTGVTTGNTESIHSMWIENSKILSKNLKSGFIDIKKIPGIKEKYENTLRIKEDLYRTSLRLNNTPNVPKFKSISIRIYQDWQSMTDQVSRSLYRLAKHLEQE